MGGGDGVSVESAKWINALRQLGHTVTTVAGAGADFELPGLAIGAPRAPSRRELDDALDGAQLVIVENLASLPLNVSARDVLYEVLEGRTAVFRHHDLAWQRERFANGDAPRTAPTWHHVTINDLSRQQLLERAVVARTMRNTFDVDPPEGARARTRATLAVSDQRVVLLPSRIIERKNVAGAVTLAKRLDAVLWLLGPAEDDYETTLNELLAREGVDVRRGLGPALSVDDAFAACDLVVLSSTWEGFGNATIESVTHRRPLAVYPYPVLAEIRSFGFDFFDLEDVSAISQFLDEPDELLLERNLEIARRHFNLRSLPAQLGAALSTWRTTQRH